MTVTGGVDMSWISKSSDTTGNPIGIGSNLTFKGSGELDNGWTFDYTVAHLNGGAYSSAAVAITMGGQTQSYLPCCKPHLLAAVGGVRDTHFCRNAAIQITKTKA
jgi:hypothetical protein